MGSTGTTTGIRPVPPRAPRHYRTSVRRHRVFFGVVAAMAALAAGVTVLLVRGGAGSSRAAVCTVTAAGGTFLLTPEQAQNAATISAVAARLGMPDHAVTVAIAAALQESKLRNLSYGDRDSLGLFQQRPSQGWGTAAQIAQPSYAAGAFYRALVKVPQWQTLDVAQAAQEVQRSADGTAYAGWESEARAVAVALTGQQAAAFSCSGGTITYQRDASAVHTQLVNALGPAATAAGVAAATGWKAASYLVANAYADGVASVSFAGQTWTQRAGTWRPDATAGNQVAFTVAPRPAATTS